MSAKQVSSLNSFLGSVNVTSRETALELAADKVSVRASGMEFRSPTSFKEWSEMTVTLHSPLDGHKVSCHGVIVACAGNKHTGYLVSMVFTSLTKQAQARLTSLAQSELGC
jgi:hypothetical protein